MTILYACLAFGVVALLAYLLYALFNAEAF
ncbi:MAG: potassium-transporting ATPase subunit F [Neisseriaceae bacterium]|nr:potassium-transporting ATPase subunit F [Neisseriaceae bacterium]MBP6863360.1 potassium-transporting ATPase subunit F [Neisseriaceae bacterium]